LLQPAKRLREHLFANGGNLTLEITVAFHILADDEQNAAGPAISYQVEHLPEGTIFIENAQRFMVFAHDGIQ
jgi:hypothetical protein